LKLIELQSYSTEKEYRDAKELNYSTLKAMIDDPESLIRDGEDISDKRGVKIGSLVDAMLTDSDNLDELFYYKPINIPTASLFELSKYIVSLDNLKEIVVNRDINEVLEGIKILGIWGSVKKEDVLIAKFDNDIFWEYLESVIESDGKMIMSPEEYSAAQNCAMLLSTHEYTKDIFNIKGSNIEVIDQFKYKFRFNGVECKVMLDKIIVDHKYKIIYPYDIKTGMPKSSDFGKNYLIYRYDLQGVLYRLALEYIAMNNPYFKDFTIANFKFIYISTMNTNYPLKWAMKDEKHYKTLVGWDTPSGYRYRGVLELIDEYKWRIENNIYDRSKEIVENNGDMIISIY
jgi:hypothetical protein